MLALIIDVDLPNSRRAFKLAKSLVTQPEFTIPYLFSNFSPFRRTPLDQGLPWWSYSAIREADKLFPGKRIFEWGTGGSTLRYARMGSHITAIEDDISWLNALSVLLSNEGLSHLVNIHHHPFDFSEPADFPTSSYLRALSDPVYDVIVIDGQDVTFRERLTCFRHAEQFMQAGGIILLDDFWRYDSLLNSNSAKEVCVFESVGPCRVGVTSTALFHY